MGPDSSGTDVASLRMTPEAFLRFLRGANETWNALAAGAAELPRFEEVTHERQS